VLQKGLVKLGLSLASPDACLLPKDLHVEAHLLDLLSDAGASPIVGFWLDAGDGFQMKSMNREGLREIGWAEVNKDGTAVILVLLYALRWSGTTTSRRRRAARIRWRCG
jgi:hypothetical protein